MFRSEKHRRAVAMLPCCNCGHEEPGLYKSQAAHVGGLVEGKGERLKVSDARCIPLCPDRPGVVGCHTRFDHHELHLNGWKLLAETLISMVENGTLKAR